MSEIESEKITLPVPLRLLTGVIFLYIATYCLFSIKYLLMAWSGDFAFLGLLLNDYSTLVDNKSLVLVIYTVLGAILGGAVLGITSLHKYSCQAKTFDVDHLWVYLLAPLLAAVIGILTYCFLQSGLLILTGSINDNANTTMVMVGYTGAGAAGAYNWEMFIKKLRHMSKDLEAEKA